MSRGGKKDVKSMGDEIEFTDEDSINSRVSQRVSNPQEIFGVVAADGVKILASATGHMDLDELHKHQKTLHTAIYTDTQGLNFIDTEYQREFDDLEAHVPFSHYGEHHQHLLDFSAMQIQPVDYDHYGFYHEHEEHHEMDDMLLRGIATAQKQNDRGLVSLYRGQIMCNAGAYEDAAVQLEKALEYYRHLNLSSVGDEMSNNSSKGSASGGQGQGQRQGQGQGQSRQAQRSAAFRRERGVELEEEKDAEEEDKDRLDFCPHIYSILVEAYYNIEQLHRATSVAREWVQKYPKNVSPYCSLAWVQMKQLQYDDCIKTCTNAINKLPETEGMMTLYSIRGKCKELLEQYEEAVEDFKYIKELASKNLARFAPEKAVFFKVDKAPRPVPQGLAPKSRPDITLRRKYGQRLSTPIASPVGSIAMSRQASTNPWELQPIAEPKGTTFNMTEALSTRAANPAPALAPATAAKKNVSVNTIRNYEVRSDMRRMCAKCQPKRDPVTRRSITNMRMGLSTDERRGASPSRVLLLADVAMDRKSHK